MPVRPPPFQSLRALLRRELVSEEGDETLALMGHLRAARRRGWLTREEFLAMCRWKSPRATRHYRLNPPGEVRAASRAALATRSERRRLELLTNLRGVNVPLASAILTLMYPRRYGVLDIRAWQLLHALGVVASRPDGRGFTFAPGASTLGCCAPRRALWACRRAPWSTRSSAAIGSFRRGDCTRAGGGAEPEPGATSRRLMLRIAAIWPAGTEAQAGRPGCRCPPGSTPSNTAWSCRHRKAASVPPRTRCGRTAAMPRPRRLSPTGKAAASAASCPPGSIPSNTGWPCRHRKAASAPPDTPRGRTRSRLRQRCLAPFRRSSRCTRSRPAW